eukprot:jgi/Hompol1/6584/HPOL_000450-RA
MPETATETTQTSENAYWDIDTLGDRLVPSPLPPPVNFVSETAGILLHATVSTLEGRTDRLDPDEIDEGVGKHVVHRPTLEQAGPRAMLYFEPKTVVAGIVVGGPFLWQ